MGAIEARRITLRLDIFSNAGRPKRLPSAFSITIA
jgi:hypothetical protein